jgi:hypothetical protein
MIPTIIQNIKPGRWFWDGPSTRSSRKMMKLMDITGGGVPAGLSRINFKDGGTSGFGDFNINAIDDKGIPCACPPNMDRFYVKSEDDLRPADFRENHPVVGSDFRHIDEKVEA